MLLQLQREEIINRGFKIGNLKGIFSQRLSKFTRSVIIFFDWWAEIDRPIREELDVFDPSDLESWDEIEKKKWKFKKTGKE